MRIAFVTGVFPKLSETFVLEQIAKLIDLGHDVRIYAFDDPGEPVRHAAVAEREFVQRTTYLAYEGKDVLAGLPRALVSGGLRLSALGDRDALARRVAHGAQGEFDVIYCHFGHVADRARRLRAAGFFRGPLVAVFHAADLTVVPGSDGAGFYRALFSEAAALLPISEHWRRRLVELGADPRKVEVRHVGVDTAALSYQPRASEANATPRIVSVGRLIEKKGFEFSLRAVARAERTLRRRLSYQLVGDGPLRESLERLAEAEGLAGRVTFHGARRSDEVAALLASADVLVAPSVTASDGDMEGIPVVLMEAMALGVPVLSTLHSGIPELVANGESGALVRERDADALAGALVELIRKPERARAFAENARRRVEEAFDSTRLARELEALLARIATQARAS